MRIIVSLLYIFVGTASAFVLPSAHVTSAARLPNHAFLSAVTSPLESPPATPVEQVVVLPDADAVGARIRQIVQDAATAAIADHGHFMLAIPGGSILKMLMGSGGDWTSKTTIAYVNHKCVAMDDADLATHAKAMNLFMGEWNGCNPIIMDGTDNGSQEAAAYQGKLEELDTLLRDDATGLPIFDLALIGVGDDGHIGSLYPNREEVLETEKWVLPVAMKLPPSITLSLPVMANARQVVVAACGVSDKYPQGKSEGMRRAIVSEEETLQTFPAVGLRSTATWVMDEAAASKLGDKYN
jgi:6-phosphogluconolactonase